MKFDHLRYFYETAKYEHLGRAARKLCVTPSTVSHGISGLEDELGVELFEKRGKNIVLSERGRILFSKTADILDLIQEVKEEVSSEDLPWQGSIRIAATHMLSDMVVCNGINSTLGLEPAANLAQVDLSISSLRSFEVIESIKSGRADIGICFSPQSDPALRLEQIHHGTLMLAVRKNHPALKVPQKKQLAELAKYRGVLPHAYGGIDICIEHPMLVKHKLIEAYSPLLIDNYHVAIEMVKSSNTWTFIPEFALTNKKENFHRGKIEAIHHPRDWKADYSISVIRGKNHVSNKIEQHLIESIATWILDFTE